MSAGAEPARGWQFWLDRGGTFTDVVAVAPDGTVRTAKLLSEDPARYEDAVLEGIERVAGRGTAIDAIRVGTTVATNALLERRGARTALVITAGLADVLRIGTQQRPDLFALHVRLPDMLYDVVLEAHERVAVDGNVLEPLDEAALEADLAAAQASGIRSVAIALLHGYRYPAHERRAAALAARLGFEHVSVSHVVSPLIKLVERGGTTVVDAYLTPVLNRYVRTLKHGLERRGDRGGAAADRRAARSGSGELTFMASHGGLVEADRFRGRDAILSGPAGGVVGMTETAREAGYERVIGFDMGGTSTDVSLYAGEFERASTALIGGVRIASPTLAINTVAAGGGSILRYALGRLTVGPDSAGADPGPACYRKGGPLAVTDANVYLGRVQPELFPHVFGPSGSEAIDAEIVTERFEQLARQIGPDADPASVAAGFLRIAVERMANAIKTISVQRGHDTREFALACFGGAGGQHACQVADALEIERILIHPLAGVLSAYGVGVADLREIGTAPVELPLDEHCVERLDDVSEALEAETRAVLGALGAARSAVHVRAFVRAAGSDSAIAVDYRRGARPAQLAAEFHARHRQQYGFAATDAELVVDSIEVEVVATAPRPRLDLAADGARDAAPERVCRAWFGDAWRDVPVYRRADLAAGAELAGPAIVAEDNATTIVELEWSARVDRFGNLVLARAKRRARRETIERTRDPIMLEIFNGQFMHIAEQMGVVLEQTAHSVNIKERLDYSCALFDSAGELVANAPHVPVHLGSMGESVRAALDAGARTAGPGSVWMLNAPYRGGTHLPDVTVVTPVFVAGEPEPAFVVASRAHHADIGGITPGSMPATSTHIDEEGVLFEPFELVRDGTLRAEVVRELLTSGAYPARSPEQNLADLRAQVAANAKGAAALGALVERYGLAVVRAYMGHIKDNAEECVRRAIARLDSGAWSLELDGGERIRVEVTIDKKAGEAHVDFTGTSAASPRNYNAPAAIARAVVLYVFRTLVAEDIPLNAGCLKPLRLTLPPGSLVDPAYPAAVVAGNVETSQAIADALLAALGALAASQGTMNNLTFGDERRQYYETLCGGTGAGPGFDGASAVHSHMTNSRLTDPEVLEARFPVRIRRFAIRSGSGGPGRHRGGDGVIRELEFLEPMTGSVLANRRRTLPFGLAGGEAGAPGRNFVIRADGTTEAFGAQAALAFGRGDRLVVETPGGGGYGPPLNR